MVEITGERNTILYLKILRLYPTEPLEDVVTRVVNDYIDRHRAKIEQGPKAAALRSLETKLALEATKSLNKDITEIDWNE